MSDVAYDPFGSRQAGLNYAQKLSQMGLDRRAGGQLAAGNPYEAAQTLYRGGDLAGGQAVRTNARAETAATQAQATADRAHKLETTLRVARALKDVRAKGGDVATAYQSMLPSLALLGTPQELQAVGQQIQQDPAFLDQLEALTAEQVKYELRAGANGDTVAIGLNPTTGATTSSVAYQAPRAPTRVAVGNDYIEVGADGNVTPLYQGAKAPEYRSVRNSDGTETIVELGGRPGGVIGGGASAPATAGSVDVVSIINDVLPGVTPNSGLRTPSQNSGAGGAERSYHLRGQAIDVPRQQGKTLNQVRDEFRARGLDVREALDEGDHWHFAWGNDAQVPNYGRGQGAPATSGGARVVAQGQNNGLSPAEQRVEQRMINAENKDTRQGTSQLRREFNGRKEVAEFREVDNSYRAMQTAVRNPSPAGDISLIFSYMKVLDPTSTVREGEFATAQNAGSAFEAIGNQYNRVLQGTRLNERQRNDFLSQAGNLRASREQRFNQIRGEYEQEAQINGYDPQAIVGGVNAQGQRQRPTNAPGIPFNLAQPQLQARQRLVQGGANPRSPLGSPLNPRYVNPADERGSFANIRPGEWFVAPDGSVLQKPPARRR